MIAEEVLVELEANVPGITSPRITASFHESTKEWAVSFMAVRPTDGVSMGCSELVAASAPNLSDAMDKCLIQAAHFRKNETHQKPVKPAKRDLLG